MRIYDPRGSVGERGVQLAPSPPSLTGATIALLPNSKPNSDVLLQAVGECLADRVGARTVLQEPKNAALAAPGEVITRLASEAAAVLAASAD